jgi:hypothetical protein
MQVLNFYSKKLSNPKKIMKIFLRNTSILLVLLFSTASSQAQTISITSGAGDTICTGTMVTFSATAGGVGTPHYQWLVNSIHVGTDSIHYSTAGLSNGDVVMCELLSSPGGSILALSGPIVMVVDNMPAPAAISGAATVCLGSTTPLTDATPGGFWASSHPLTASVSAGGVVTGAAPGNDTIAYTIINTCGTGRALHIISVITAPVLLPIGGPTNVCHGATITLTDTTGGTWSSSTPSIATISSTGVVTGISPGFDTITYAASNGCGTASRRKVIAVQNTLTAGPITGSSSVCVNDTIHLAGALPTGGTWRSSDNTIAGFPPGGGGAVVLRGIIPGTVTVTFVAGNSCGADSATKIITVNPLPLVYPITGFRDSVCPGSVLTLNEYTTGGTWSSQTPAVATIDASGNVTGVAPGVDTIFYSATNACGTTTQPYPVYTYCPSDVLVPGVNVAKEITIYPNPASDMITVSGTNIAQIQVVNMYGQLVMGVRNSNVVSIAGLPAGIYHVSVYDGQGNRLLRQQIIKQ